MQHFWVTLTRYCPDWDADIRLELGERMKIDERSRGATKATQAVLLGAVVHWWEGPTVVAGPDPDPCHSFLPSGVNAPSR